MKKLQRFSLVFMCIGLLITSCSDDDNPTVNVEKTTISFGAVLNDLLADKAAKKQATGDIPACSNDEPSYVRIILKQGDTEVVGTSGNPFRVDLVPGQIYTDYAPELELTPGTYVLDHFAVYNAGGEIIWLSPRGGFLGELIANPLPLTINLGAGEKQYVDVPVLCYDQRDVNEYGYLFFDLIPTQVVPFCFFANYCNENGRHYPGRISVNIWLGTDDSGTVLYSDMENIVSTQGANPAAQPLCIALPYLTEYAANEDYIYYEITLLDWDGVYGNVNNTILSGTLNRDDIQANFDGDAAVDYEHIQFGCNGENAAQFDAEVATTWFNLLTELSRTTYFNPQSARLFAYSGLSLYESVVHGMPSYRSIFPDLSGETIEFNGNPGDYYWPASANAALAQITKRLLQDYPQPLDLPAIEQLEANFNQEYLATVSAEKVQRSIEFGKRVADEIYEWSRLDGTFSPCPPYTPSGAPGSWEPTPPLFLSVAGACQGNLRTFATNIKNMALPGPPPAYSTDPASEFYQMNLAVFEITQNLTPEELNIIQAWRDIPGLKLNGPTHMIQITVDIIEEENLNLADAAVLLAKTGMAIYDAIAASFYAKFEYELLRPITYIRDVLGYTTWESVYVTPPHPSYPAVANSPVAAAVEILEGYFGTAYSFEDATQQAMFGVFEYESLDALIEDVKISRTHSGLNYQISVDAAEELGRIVGEAINSLNFRN